MSRSRGQRAYRPVAEVLRLNAKSVREASAIAFPRDCRSQLYQLVLIEFFPQARKQSVRHRDGSFGNGVGIFENEPLQLGEIEICSVAIKIGQLLG